MPSGFAGMLHVKSQIKDFEERGVELPASGIP